MFFTFKHADTSIWQRFVTFCKVSAATGVSSFRFEQETKYSSWSKLGPLISESRSNKVGWIMSPLCKLVIWDTIVLPYAFCLRTKKTCVFCCTSIWDKEPENTKKTVSSALGTKATTAIFFYIALATQDEYQVKRPINLDLYRPRYALVYNNIIK